jgi:hypothetical protein
MYCITEIQDGIVFRLTRKPQNNIEVKRNKGVIVRADSLRLKPAESISPILVVVL